MAPPRIDNVSYKYIPLTEKELKKLIISCLLLATSYPPEGAIDDDAPHDQDSLDRNDLLAASVDVVAGHFRRLKSRIFEKIESLGEAKVLASGTGIPSDPRSKQPVVGDAPGKPMLSSTPEIRVDVGSLIAFVNEEAIALKTEQIATFLHAIANASKTYNFIITFNKMKRMYPILQGGNSTRIFGSLPDVIKALIDSHIGVGYQLKREI